MSNFSSTELLDPLTQRELEVLALLADGLSDREIAERLTLSYTTVKWYNKQIFSKLDVENRRKAVMRGRELGLLEPDRSAPTPRHNLPAQMTPFVGRERELAELARLLWDEQVRLVTILAPGGMGKTRLALEAARQQLGRFPNGVYLVELAPVTSPDFVVSAIAEGLGFQFYPGGEPQQQLLDFLREKSLLLVLDNFEHLLDGAALVSEILTYAPGVKALATSRERLNLSGETVYTLGGMAFPEHVSDSGQDYSAVQLFVQCARRVQPNFVLNGDGAVVRICQLAQGMPLAIELAAACVGALSPGEIAGEITRSLDFLRTEMRDVPERLRSVRAVFEATWGRLSEDEQIVFRRLSVFRGGCTREAAQAVTGAAVAALTGLVNKALLWRNPGSGRYEVHELLRQYAEQELEAAGETEAAKDAHCAYYADFIHQREDDDLLRRSLKAEREQIDAELDNVRSAFAWAVEWGKVCEIGNCAFSLMDFYAIRGLYREGEESYRRAVARLRGMSYEPEEEQRRVLGQCLACQGACLRRLARSREAKELLDESLALLRPLPVGRELLFLVNIMGLVADDAAEAKQWFEEALAIAQDNNLQLAIAIHTINLGSTAERQGDYAAAQQLAQEALVMSRNLHLAYGEEGSLLALSKLALYQGDYPAAKQLAQESFAAAEAIEHRWWLPVPCRILGDIAYAQGDYGEAKQYYQKSLAISQDVGNRAPMVLALGGLGSAARKQSAYPEAWGYFQQALEIANDIHDARCSLGLLSGVIELLADEGETGYAAELSALVLHHTASEQPIKDRVLKPFRTLEAQLPPEVFAAAIERGKARNLEATVRELLAEAGTRG